MRKSVEQQLRIIAAIADAREEAKVSQAELSARLGGSETLIQKIEAGTRGVQAWELIEIANALGIDPCELLRRALPRKRSQKT